MEWKLAEALKVFGPGKGISTPPRWSWQKINIAAAKGGLSGVPYIPHPTPGPRCDTHTHTHTPTKKKQINIFRPTRPKTDFLSNVRQLAAVILHRSACPGDPYLKSSFFAKKWAILNSGVERQIHSLTHTHTPTRARLNRYPRIH